MNYYSGRDTEQRAQANVKRKKKENEDGREISVIFFRVSRREMRVSPQIAKRDARRIKDRETIVCT